MAFFSDIISDSFLSVGLAMDCLAVSIAVSLSKDGESPTLRWQLPFFFGGFQGGMAYMGWAVGSLFLGWIEEWDHWLALLLLSGVGIHMILESRESHEEEKKKRYDSFKVILFLSVATSIDALAVGLGFASLGESMGIRAGFIALGSIVFTRLGLRFGKTMGLVLGNRAELVGGLILILIGVKIFIEHTIFA